MASFCLVSCTAPVSADTYNALAIFYPLGDFRRGVDISATLSLPRVAENRSWYTNWLMLLDQNKSRLKQPFIQVGLMRWQKNDYKLSSYIAYNKAGSIIFRDLEILPDGPHRIRLYTTSTNVVAEVDGKVAATYARSEIYPTFSSPFVQIAAEVQGVGDHASGVFQDVWVVDGTGRKTGVHDFVCRYIDRGLRLRKVGSSLRADGIFDPTLPSELRGCH